MGIAKVWEWFIRTMHAFQLLAKVYRISSKNLAPIFHFWKSFLPQNGIEILPPNNWNARWKTAGKDAWHC